jgi:hypothetical protein
MVMVPSIPIVGAFPYDPYVHSSLQVMDTWRDPGGGGEDLHFRVNTDGSRLLLLGYGAPNEVRLTDLDTGNATILKLPSPDFKTLGADWSMNEDKVVVWGVWESDPLMVVYDLPSAEVNDSVEWLDLVDLAQVTEVSYLADDVIVSN